MRLHVRAISDEAGFGRLAEPWNRLAAGMPGRVFLRHEWFDAAWAWRRTDGAALWILGVYAGDALVGVLPLLRPERSPRGERLLSLLTVPDTQWCDLLVEPAAAAAVGKALVEHLWSNASQWDTLCLERLAPHSQAETALLPALKAGGLACRLEATDCNLFVDLKGGWDGYYALRSRHVKKACNLAANRLARAGELTLERFGPGDASADRLQRLLDEIVHISAQSWKRDTGKSLETPGPRAFLSRLAGSAGGDGWLAVWLLRLDGRPMAMELQVVGGGGDVYALRADFDESYRALSPGTYLNREIVRSLFAQDSGRYYMGPGQNAYKKQWSATGEAVYALTAYSPTVRGRAGRLWSEMKGRLRSLRDRDRPEPGGEAFAGQSAGKNAAPPHGCQPPW